MRTICEIGRAKINFTLDVKGKAGDLHELDMLVCSIDLHDVVRVSLSRDGKTRCVMDGVPQNGSNSAVRAAGILSERFGCPGLDISIEKGIPVCGGFGGSSADAAAVIRAAVRLLDLDEKQITPEFLLRAGSDVPAMYRNGLKRVRGKGQIIDFIHADLPYKIGFMSNRRINTRDAFALFDELRLVGGDSTERALEALGRGEDLTGFLSNDLYAPAVRICPGIRDDLEKIKDLGAVAACMTGSGGSVYGLFAGAVPGELRRAEIAE